MKATGRINTKVKHLRLPTWFSELKKPFGQEVKHLQANKKEVQLPSLQHLQSTMTWTTENLQTEYPIVNEKEQREE